LACWEPKDTNTQSQYATLIAFPGQSQYATLIAFPGQSQYATLIAFPGQSQYATLIAFPGQQSLQERASMLLSSRQCRPCA